MNKRTGIIGGLVLAVVVGAGAYAALVLPDQLARREVNRFAAALPPGRSLQYGAAHYGLFDRTLRLEDLTVQSAPDAPWHAKVLNITRGGGDGTASSPFHADAMTVEGWSRGDTTVDRMVLTDVTLRPGPVPTFTGLPSLRALRLLTQTVSIGHAAFDGLRDPESSAARITADGFGQGKVAHIVIDDVHGTVPETRIQRTEVRDIDVDGLFAVFDPTDYRPGKPDDARRPLLGMLDIAGLATDAAQGHTSVARLHLARFAGRPFIVPPTAPGAPADPRIAIDMFAALAADQAGLETLKFEPKTGDGDGLSVGRIAFDGYAAGKLRNVRVQDLASTSPKAFKASLGLFELRDADARRLLVVAAQSAQEAAQANGPIDTEALMLRMRNTVKLPYFDMQALAATLPAGPQLTLALLRGEATYDGDEVTGLHQMIGQLTIPLKGLDLAPESRRMVTAFGRDRVVLDLEVAMSLAAQRVSIDTLDLKADALGELRLTGAFGGVDRAKLDVGDYQTAFLGATVERATLRYEDASLVERLMAVTAVRTGVAPDAIQAEMIAQAGAFPVPEIAAAVADFLRQPHILAVQAIPPQPVPLLSLAGIGPDRAGAVLGLKATAE